MIVDDYINCDDLIKEANELYYLAMKKELNDDYRNYFNSMNNYINTYQTFREELIKKYIEDLNKLI